MQMDESAAEDCLILENALRRMYSLNRHVSGGGDCYGIRVEVAAESNRAFELTLTFKSGARYCCFESRCHFGSWSDLKWKTLRDELTLSGAADFGPIRISKLRVVVEAGAEFGGFESNHGRVMQEPTGYSYEDGPFEEIVE